MINLYNRYILYFKSQYKRVETHVIILAAVSLFFFILEIGFPMPEWFLFLIYVYNQIFLVIFFLFILTKLIINDHKKQFISRYWFSLVIATLSFLFVIISEFFIDPKIINQVFFEATFSRVLFSDILISEFLIVLTLFSGQFSVLGFILDSKVSPARIFALGFLSVILIGTFLLILPNSTVDGISLIDAFFTAVSAACVTGLTVVDTGTAFTRTGQTVIAMLIQLGGLGILTFTAFFIYLGGVKSNLKQTMLVKELIQSDHISNVNHYLFQIIITTFVIELIGAVCLYAWWTKFQFDNYSLLFESIFISISAFCNAGFSLHADSFSSQHADSISILMVAFLFIAGSLGIKALTEIRHYLVKYKWQHQNFRFSIQTKIILRATVTLLISGTVLFLISEFNASLSGLSLLAKIKAAFFNSAVSRTSGFNSVNFSSITTVTALWFVAFMFIGGASGSTAGGIKVNTVSVLYLWLRAVLKGEKDCIYEGRSIALGTFHQAILVFTMSTVIVFIFILLLIISEDFSFVDITFEIVSAFATVGVSKGITTDLSSWGKFIVSLTMFIGRIGVVSFALTLMDRQEKVVRVSYPTEGVMIG